MKTIELDYAVQNSANEDDPSGEAERWVNELGLVNVNVEVKQLHGPAGGNPVLTFTGEPLELIKLLSNYFTDSPDEFKDAVDGLLEA